LNLLSTLPAKKEHKELAEEQQKAWNKKDLHRKKNS
jgi:phage pi2 protein 07